MICRCLTAIYSGRLRVYSASLPLWVRCAAVSRGFNINHAQAGLPVLAAPSQELFKVCGSAPLPGLARGRRARPVARRRASSERACRESPSGPARAPPRSHAASAGRQSRSAAKRTRARARAANSDAGAGGGARVWVWRWTCRRRAASERERRARLERGRTLRPSSARLSPAAAHD